MPKRVQRFTIADDGQAHDLPVGPIAAVVTSDPGFGVLTAVDVLVEVADNVPTRRVQLVKTGQDVPTTWNWLASLVEARSPLHLYSVVL